MAMNSKWRLHALFFGNQYHLSMHKMTKLAKAVFVTSNKLLRNNQFIKAVWLMFSSFMWFNLD